MNRRSFAAAIVFAALVLSFPAVAKSRGGLPKVRIETSLGPILVELETKRAPLSSNNFLMYVDRKRFDGTSFYRAARSPGRPDTGLVQGGINRFFRGALQPIAHEPTSKTGLAHVDGTVSMARNAPGRAMGDFFITVGRAPYLDAAPNSPGYAAFGRVVAGMPVVRRILAGATYPGGRSEATKGQSLIKPVRIISVRRVQ